MSTMEEVDLEMEQAVEKTASNSSTGNPPSTSNRRRTKILGMALATVAILGLALGLGFGLRDDNNGTEMGSKTASSNNSGDVPSPVPPSKPTTTTTNTNPTTPTGNTGLAFASTRLAAISPETLSQTYASCDDLAADLKLSMRMIGRRQIGWNKWYFTQPTVTYEEGVTDGDTESEGTANMAPANSLSSDMGGGDAARASGSGSSAAKESSFGTNNQVKGVEEPDIVQSNGEVVFAVYGSEIIELDAATSTITRRTKVPVDCYQTVNAMLLVGDRLVVITNVNSWCSSSNPVESTVATTPPEDQPIVSSDSKTRMLMYNTDTMEIVSDETVRGWYMDSRAIGTNIHLITSTYFDSNRLLQYIDPYLIETNAGKKLNETQYQKLAEAELEKRLDAYCEQLASELNCTSTQQLAWLQNTGDELDFTNALESMVTISSISVTAPSKVSTKTMLIPSGGFQVYSSEERLVLAIGGWWVSGTASQETYLLTYKYQNATTVGHTLGTVPGYVLNQFSLDHLEQNGVDYLRVATSTQSMWVLNDKGIWESTDDSTSQVSILEFNDGQDGRMPLVGKVSNLGKPGETIYSVRFLGDKGFVVTFEQMDPFYTLDLSDPINPQKAGELVIPGYSSYLHPAGDDLILGVGQAADANGTTLGLQISLFDVSDFANPKRVQNFQVSSGRNSTSSSYASSDAEYDHKAFRYLVDSGLLIIPVTYYESVEVPCEYFNPMPMDGVATKQAAASDAKVANSSVVIDYMPSQCWNTTGGFDGFRVYEVSATAGIGERGSIEHASGNAFAYGCWSSAWLAPRSLVFSGELMTLKGHSILSHDLSTLQEIADPIILDTDVKDCRPWIAY
jgi:Beta propeller domain